MVSATALLATVLAACGPRFDPKKIATSTRRVTVETEAGGTGEESTTSVTAQAAGSGATAAQRVTSTFKIPASKNAAVAGGTIKVGGLFPLTGGLATLGKPAYQGAQAYFNWVNDHGGVAGKKIQFVPCDDQGDDTLSTSCAKKLVEQDGIFVMGPSFTPFSLTVVSYLKQAGVPWIGYDGINIEGFSAPNVVTVGAPIDSMAHALMPYWFHKVEKDTGSAPKSIGAIVLDSAPAKTYLDEAKRVICPKLGCQIAHESLVTYTTTNFTTICQSMNDVDAIWIVTDPASAVKILVQCPKPRKGFLGQHGIYLDLTLNQSGKASDGILANSAVLPDSVSTPATAEQIQIITTYYPKASFGYFTDLAYAGARMLADLVKVVSDTGAALTRSSMLQAASTQTNYDCHGLCKNVNLTPPAATSGGNHNVWIVRADFSSGSGKWVLESGPIDAFTTESWPCPGRPKPC